MAIDMAKRRRIIKKSRGAISIHKYRAQQRKAEGKPAKAAILKPTQVVKKERTPEEFAKLSPAQQLYVKKGITASSEEGAIKQIEAFKAKALEKQPAPPAGPSIQRPGEEAPTAPVQGPTMEGGQSMQEAMPQFDPIEKELALYGTVTSQRIKQAITGAAVIGIVGLGIAGIGTVAAGGVARGAADPLASKLGSIENLKLARDAMGSKVLRAAAGQIPAKLIRKNIQSVLARDIAINTVNAAKTMSFLTKIYHSKAVRVGAAAVGGAAFLASVTLNVLGTYPFAGFIAEESLQTLGMDSSRAITDVEWKLKKGEAVTPEELDMIKRTLEMEREVLSPDAAGNVIGSVPIQNTVDELLNFYESAAIVNENKETRFQKILEQVAGEAGEEIDW